MLPGTDSDFRFKFSSGPSLRATQWQFERVSESIASVLIELISPGPGRGPGINKLLEVDGSCSFDFSAAFKFHVTSILSQVVMTLSLISINLIVYINWY